MMQDNAVPPSAMQFDVSRAILRSAPDEQPMMVKDTQSLRLSLSNQEISEETSLQVIDINGQVFGFVTRELLLFDAAQGTQDGMEWVITFCPICNAGALFSAKIADLHYHFTAGGIYNAMAILRDVETGSYWDVINGVCLYGPSQGKRLQRFATLRHMLARDALVAFPSIELATLPLSESEIAESHEDDKFRLAARPEWSSRLANTLTFEDARLPRFDMGLGIWTPKTARYYSLITMNTQDNIAIDTLEGRKVIIYIDPESRIPDAFYTGATSARWLGTTLELNNGQRVQHGTVLDRDRNLIMMERPLQLFQRWYGFAVMFRQCEIFGTTASDSSTATTTVNPAQ